jgi:hypothetical protein
MHPVSTNNKSVDGFNHVIGGIFDDEMMCIVQTVYIGFGKEL